MSSATLDGSTPSSSNTVVNVNDQYWSLSNDANYTYVATSSNVKVKGLRTINTNVAGRGYLMVGSNGLINGLVDKLYESASPITLPDSSISVNPLLFREIVDNDTFCYRMSPSALLLNVNFTLKTSTNTILANQSFVIDFKLPLPDYAGTARACVSSVDVAQTSGEGNIKYQAQCQAVSTAGGFNLRLNFLPADPNDAMLQNTDYRIAFQMTVIMI